ncbi:MAG: hypothetical protein V9F00_08310 [Nocardioides sp.]
MDPAPLTAEEMAALPPIRPRWVAQVAGLVGGCAGFGAFLVADASQKYAGSLGWDLHWTLALLIFLVGSVGPWLLLSPLLFRVGLRWSVVVILTLLHLAAPFVGWLVGFRLAHLPYRDWRPSDNQRPTVRLVPGAGFHVLQADLDRLARARPAEPSVLS